MAEEAEEQSSEDGAADDLLGMDEVPAIAQMAWADFTGSGSLMTMGLCTLCFIHAVIEVRIAANPTKDPLAPSTRLAGTCPAIRESGEAEVHTLLFDVAITYTGRCEVRGGEDAPRASLKCLAEAFGLIDDEGEEIPEDKLERLFERVRLIAAVPYLEALEDLLRERLVAVTTAVGTRRLRHSRPIRVLSARRVVAADQPAVAVCLQARDEEERQRSLALHAWDCVDGRRVG